MGLHRKWRLAICCLTANARAHGAPIMGAFQQAYENGMLNLSEARGATSQGFGGTQQYSMHPFVGRLVVHTMVPQHSDFEWCGRIRQLARDDGVSLFEDSGERARNDGGQIGVLDQGGKGEEMWQRYRYPRRVFAHSQRLLKRDAVVHFRSSCKAPFRDEPVDRSFLLAAKGDDDQRKASES